MEDAKLVAEFEMAAGWTAEDTKSLIGCWGEQNVQEQLDSIKRNRDIYERTCMNRDTTSCGSSAVSRLKISHNATEKFVNCCVVG